MAPENLERDQDQEAQQVEKSGMSVELILPDSMTGLEQVLSLFCNFSGNSDAFGFQTKKKEEAGYYTGHLLLFLKCCTTRRSKR